MLAPEVARTMRKAMADVVEQGTARRLNGVFKLSDGRVLTVGGKTGSGDNRFETFSRSGAVITSRATNRTATFVFYIGERYYGVITAYVQGREADNYRFTSGLPVSLLKLMAPTLLAKLDKNPQRRRRARRSRAPLPAKRPAKPIEYSRSQTQPSSPAARRNDLTGRNNSRRHFPLSSRFEEIFYVPRRLPNSWICSRGVKP